MFFSIINSLDVIPITSYIFILPILDRLNACGELYQNISAVIFFCSNIFLINLRAFNVLKIFLIIFIFMFGSLIIFNPLKTVSVYLY